MASEKQIAANRRNAQKSTGPRTPEGKARVCLNALRHGLSARVVVLPDENAEEFHQLCDDLETEWQPQGRTEQYLLEQMAVAQWKSARAERVEAALLQAEDLSDDDLKWHDRLQQQQFRLQRAYLKALKDLRVLQKERPAQPLAEPAPMEDMPDMRDAPQNLTEESQSPAPPPPPTCPPGWNPNGYSDREPLVQTRFILQSIERGKLAPDGGRQ
jgi:hypothetical protein